MTLQRSLSYAALLVLLSAAIGAAQEPANDIDTAVADEPASIGAEFAPMAEAARAQAVEVDGRPRVKLSIDLAASNENAANRELVIDVTPEQMQGWEEAYVRDLAASEQVVKDVHRELIVEAKGEAPGDPAAITAEAETPLIAFQGLPKLAPDLEQRLIERCLMIRSVNVVDDVRASGMGPWSFGYLMQELANEPATGVNPADFVEDWLAHWQRDVTVNGFKAPQRKRGIEQLILNHWPRNADHELDLSKSPFRLLAIILRLDLRSNRVLGSQRIDDGGAGEARLVYCAVDKDGVPLAFTAIFEYGINRRNFLDVWRWSRRWYALRNLDPETQSEAYRVALEALTHQFTDRDSNIESPPNLSSLNALRTNEIDLVLKVKPRPPATVVWEVREFRLDAGNEGNLRQVTVKQTPDLTFNRTPVLANFVNGQQSAILGKRHQTPVEFPRGEKFLGASAITPANEFWEADAIASKEARHLFSLGTCSGCHAREAFPPVGETPPAAPFDNVGGMKRQPPHFTHVRPRKAGEVAELSAFLTGKDVAGMPFKLADPAGQMDTDGMPLLRPFGDLPIRAHDLYGLANFGAFYELFRAQRSQVH